MKTIKIKNYSEIPDNYTGEVTISGNVIYMKNGLFHREDGPAVESRYGYIEYHLNGKLHRIGGPAVIYSDGGAYYYINGKLATKEQHDLLYNMLKLKGINHEQE